MEIKIRRLSKGARLPTYEHQEDAGMDFYASETVHFMPGEHKCVYTKIAVEIPNGFVGLIWDKSNVSFNLCLKVIGGVIDAGCEREVFIFLLNHSNKEVTLEKGHKVAQMVIQRFESCDIVDTNTH